MTTTFLDKLDASEESRNPSMINCAYPGNIPGSDLKILFEDMQASYQFPGIPYRNRAKYSKTLITDRVPKAAELDKLLGRSNPNLDILVCPLDLAKGARHYMPTTYKRLTKNLPDYLAEQHLGKDECNFSEERRVLLQLQTEIETKAATIDSAIVHGRRDLDTIVSKAHLAHRIYTIGRLYGHLRERKFPLDLGDLSNPSEWDNSLITIKGLFTEFLSEIPFGNRKYHKVIKKQNVPEETIRKKFFYLDNLKKMLGDNLLGVLVYGSSVQSDDPSKYSDYDNLLRVKDVGKALRAVSGSSPNAIDGQFVNWKSEFGEMPKSAKHIGLRFIPESEDYILRLVRTLHDPREFLEDTLVIYGEFPCLRVGKDEAKERGISQSYAKIKNAWSSLNWAYKSPEKLLDKEGLFEFVVKNKRFCLQHFLNATSGHKRRSKEEMNRLLSEVGMFVPKHRADLEHIRISVRDSAIDAFNLQKDFFRSGWKPNLNFLSDGRNYTLSQEFESVWDAADSD